MAKSTAAARGTLTDKKPAPSTDLALPSTVALQKLAADFTIELTPFAKGAECIAFRDASLVVSVTTQATHQTALELLKQGKTLKKGIQEHWIAPRRWLAARKDDISAIEAQDLALVDPGVMALNKAVLDYEAEDKKRVAIEQERIRQEREREAAEDRRRELADLEARRLTEEEASEALSQRERLFVFNVFKGATSTRAAELAGYADPAKHGDRLMRSEKVTAAVTAAHRAQALEDQQKALQSAPLDLAPQRGQDVAPNLGRVAGMRTTTTHTGDVLDGAATLAQLLDFVRREARGEDVSDLSCPPEDLFVVSGPMLNDYARSMHKNIERWAGIRYNKKETKS